MFQANSTSNHVSKWCKTGIILNKPAVNRRPASYLKRWLKRSKSILVHPSPIFNLPEKCSLSFPFIPVNVFPHIIWKLKDLMYFISFKMRPFYNICAYICIYFPTWMAAFELATFFSGKAKCSQDTFIPTESTFNLPTQEFSGWRVRLKHKWSERLQTSLTSSLGKRRSLPC